MYVLYLFADGDEDRLDLALLHYCFDNEEHTVMTRPHGNSKSNTGFVRTMPSTLSKVRELSEDLRPKHVVSKLSQSVGGIIGASSASQLPRNRQQSADCRRQLFSSKSPASHSRDPLFPLMLMCKESEGSKSSSHTQFVRIVTNSPQPMAVLVYDWTLRDMERFCAEPQNFTILSVDPTFNLGSFHVTVTTYRHPMLKSRQGSRQEHPVMLGALFVHQCKTFSTYNFFFSHLVGLCPGLKNIRCFGTDGEKALVNALHTQFKSAIHLRCFLHFRGNLQDKLADIGISRPNAQEFLKDVFGNPALLENGLVDAEVTELDDEFDNLKDAWDKHEVALSGRAFPSFHQWFKRNCLEEVRNCMLKDKREQAGLGSPPEPFYTNDVESKNRVLKHQAEYKPQELPAFVQTMKDLFEEQKQEIEKAMIGVGEYQLLPAYSNLEIPHSQWFKKSEKQRHRLIERFMNSAVRGGENVDVKTTEACTEDQSGDAVVSETQDAPSTSNPLQCTELPVGIQSAMWNKVQKYLEDKSSYTKAPGMLDYSCVLVKSASSTKPHFVERTGNGRYKCDKECLMFKSTNGVCAHCLLVANLNGEVDTFIQMYSRTKNPINYTQLAQHGLPVGGKKPSSKRKASSKKTTAKIRKTLTDTDVRTKRGESSRSATHSHPAGLHSGCNTSPPPTNVYSVGISARYANFGSGAISSPSVTMQHPPPLLSLQHPQQPANISTMHMPQPQMNPMNTPSMRPPPPPLYHQSPELSVGQPFRVVFSNSRISRCQGCRGKIDHNCDRIVLQHKEHVLFQNPHTGRWQMSQELRNTYYHARFTCLTAKHPDFTPSEIELGAVEGSLDLPSLNVLREEFGLIV